MIGAIILAAGRGTRYGGYKQFEMVAGKSVIAHTYELYEHIADKIVVVIPEGYDLQGVPCKVAIGGETRFDSIKAGFEVVTDCDKILVVDGVNPNTSLRIITDLLSGLDNHEVVTPVIPAVYTVCQVVDGEVRYIQDKRDLFCYHTPTAVRGHVLKDILNLAEKHDQKWMGFGVAYMASQYGYTDIGVVMSDEYNTKITYKRDLEALDRAKNYGLYEPVVPGHRHMPKPKG